MIKAGGSAGHHWFYRVLRDVGKKITLNYKKGYRNSIEGTTLLSNFKNT
jgi:hypothetical protein